MQSSQNAEGEKTAARHYYELHNVDFHVDLVQVLEWLL